MKFFKKQPNNFQKIIFIILTVVFVSVIGLSVPVKPILAGWPTFELESIPEKISITWQKITKVAKEAIEKAGSEAFGSALRSVLNDMAYETATYLASGNEGQKPTWYGEDWGTMLKNVGDNVAGQYIENVGKSGEWGAKFNLCEPSLDVKVKIGLGLVQVKKPDEPECTFSKMVDNWKTEADRLKSMSKDDYLAKVQNMFEPTSNDLSASFQLQTGLLEKEAEEKLNKKFEREEGQGWITIKNIDDSIKGLPGQNEEERDKAMKELWDLSKGKYTGQALIDAANIFLNQYAITLFTRKMRELGRTASQSYTSPYNWDNLSSEDAVFSSGGIAKVKESLREIVEPNLFYTQSSYDILADLSSCPDRNNAGPNNCVIDNKFKNAITNKMTVKNAIEQGYLDPNKIVGFNSDGFEPKYDEGYPYRSLIILRKFRILPIGWEIAAEYIKDNSNVSNVTLGELVDCYDNNEKWCKGLVDPNWVLKAPLNYCNRRGYGPEIIDSQVVKIEGKFLKDGEDKYELKVLRSDNYCADEQTCIDENDDGTCNYYGYCVKEKRKWNFTSPSCKPQYNTCQTFINKDDGRTVSYLENTLEYCSQDAAGCKSYCTDYDYNSSLFTCNFNDIENKVYLNNNTEECSSENEGCHEFIRTKAGTGANLLINSNFEQEDNGWTLTSQGEGVAVITSEDSYLGQNSLKITHTGIDGQESFATQIIEGIQGEEEITLSYYVKTSQAGNGPYQGPWIIVWGLDEYGNRLTDPRNVDGGKWIDATIIKSFWDGDNQWKQIIVSFITPKYTKALEVQPFVQGYATTAYFDAIKVERGGNATRYSEYREQGLVYQKLIPDYLEDLCYGNKGKLLDNAPAECSKYVRHCYEEEVGCEMYTSQTTGTQIPAKIKPTDYCEAECVGYDTYIQNETIFDSRRVDYFIPNTARTCSAEFVGCDEFTNLDAIESGGEAREYYQYLRQCSLPSDSECANFYTWEGSDESGYQLKYFSLKVDSEDVDGNGFTTDPYLVNTGRYDGMECNSAEDYDPINNPDCKEFYDAGGNVYYKFYHHTVTCSDNCHPYRRTEVNVDLNLGQADCNALGSGLEGVEDNQFYWDDNSEKCYFCKNGGVWNNQQGGCIYMAIPGEGEKCEVSQSGCREYSGNTSNNYQIISQYNFDNESYEGWTGSSGTNINLSQETLTTEGQSLLVSDGNNEISIVLGNILNNTSAYNLEFLAKSPGFVDVEVCLRNSGSNPIKEVCFNQLNENEPLPSVSISSEWGVHNVYIDLKNYYGKHSIASDEELVIRGTGSFYIDNIKLIEVLDRYYLIKNSWNTPETCDQNIYGEYEPWHDLGCDYYKDRDGANYYLHNFSQLCEESGVGCEIMIDTHNYSDYNSNEWIKGGWSIEVPEDNFDYVVYDKNKICNSEEKGCQLLGQASAYEDEEVYTNTYYKNNPDDYNNILCNEKDVGCETWNIDCSSTDGNCVSNVVFKNPGNMTCEWRDGDSGEAWYKTKVKRCANNGNICQTSSDCPMYNNESCDDNEDCGIGICNLGKCYATCDVESEEEDKLCPTYPLKTIGLGGERIYQPSRGENGNWVGVCEASVAGCTEYIDPVSSFSENLIVNGDFYYDINKDGQGDIWNNRRQSVDLDKFTLYILAVEAGVGKDFTATIIPDDGTIYQFDDSFPGEAMDSITVSASNGKRNSVRFYTNRVFSGKVEVSDTSVHSGNLVELKKAIINYRLRQDVDRETCPDNEVNFEKGCVLFNERIQDGNGHKKALVYDADENNYSPIEEEADSNVLLKVEPDRACGEWLACKSYVLDERENSSYMEPGEKVVCYERGLCDRLNDQGKCDHYVVTNKGNLNYNSAMDIDNISGYAKIGYLNGSFNNNYYPISSMDQVGGLVDFDNGSFEIYDSSGYPAGWDAVDKNNEKQTIEWRPGIFRTIDNPYQAKEVEGINYTNEGKSFLKYSPREGAVSSEFINVQGGESYGFSALINTKNLYVIKGNLNAEIKIDVYNALGTYLRSYNVLSLGPGEGWTRITKKIDFDEDIDKVKIIITVSDVNADVTGEIYVDDIKLESALEYKEGEVIPQTCRLYPTEDSLSCEYVNDAGITTKGWYGYCLEYDRYPGNENNCLMWYPIDKVQGRGIEEGAGYQGRGPLYYCEEANKLIPVEYRKIRNIAVISCARVNCNVPGYVAAWFSNGDGECEEGFFDSVLDVIAFTYFPVYYTAYNIITMGGDGYDDTQFSYCLPSGDLLVPDNHPNMNGGVITSGGAIVPTTIDANHSARDGWYKYNNFDGVPSGGGIQGFNEKDNGIKYYDPTTGKLFDSVFAYCKTIAQVVDPTGQNKYWRGRVYEGTDYTLPKSGYPVYSTDYAPFGSIPEFYLGERSNPTEWDGDDANGFNPLYIKTYKYGTNDDEIGVDAYAGFPHHFYYDDYNNNGTCNGISYNFTSLGYCSENGRPCLIASYCDYINEDPPIIKRISSNKNRADCQSGEGSCIAINQLGSGQESISRIFARSYGHWVYADINNGYKSKNGLEWLPPNIKCSEGTRPDYPDDYCGIPPRIENIKINGKNSSNIVIKNSSFINLTFNSIADSQQLPLTMYAVDWGDGDNLMVSGVEMRGQPLEDDPHSIYHLYSYWDLRNKYNDNVGNINCGNSGEEVAPGISCIDTPCCVVQPSVKIKDNWDWCNNGEDGSPCPSGGYQPYNAWVIVYEE